MLIVFQTLFTLFALYALSSVVARKKTGDLGPRGLVFWVLFWIVATVFVWYPEATNRLAQAFGIGRGADFVLYISLVVIFFVLFRLHVKLESMSRDVTKVVRDKALDTNLSSRTK
jgi:hypothetical protein